MSLGNGHSAFMHHPGQAYTKESETPRPQPVADAVFAGAEVTTIHSYLDLFQYTFDGQKRYNNTSIIAISDKTGEHL